MLQDADALPQLIGDWKTVDQWQTHINQLFYRFRGNEIRKYYQTFASADYRLAHALAADYVEQVSRRDKTSKEAADTRPQIRKCVGSLWDALTTVKYLLEHHTEETGEEQQSGEQGDRGAVELALGHPEPLSE